MRYYSEAVVKKIVKDAMDYSMTISQSIPMSIEDYSSIEIPDKHGALKDANTLKELTKNTEIRNSRGEIYPIGKAIAKMIDEAPTVVESEE